MVAQAILGLALVVALNLATLVKKAVPEAGGRFLLAALLAGGAEYALAAAGILRQWQRIPPPILLLVAAVVLGVVRFSLSPAGRKVAELAPWASLIGFQAFRLPLELVMHRAATDGLMPPQMTFTGLNFDILSGTLAVPVAWLAYKGRAPRALLFAWNVLGSLLLAAIVIIAVASTPTFAAFGPDKLNTWVADPPYVLLPGILVPAALLGHVLAWRKLLASSPAR